jgi:hypothetical protein
MEADGFGLELGFEPASPRPRARRRRCRQSFELLRTHSQRTGRKLHDFATAVLDSHLLLTPRAASESAEPAG